MHIALKCLILKHINLFVKFSFLFLLLSSKEASAEIDLHTALEVESFQNSLQINPAYFSSSDGIDKKLVETWKFKFPKIYDMYQKLSLEEKKFVTVFRGIKASHLYPKTNLNQTGRTYRFGPHVFTSPDPLVALIYAGSGNIFKFRIPIGFFPIQKNSIQFVISNKSEASNLNAFLVEYAEEAPNTRFVANKIERLKAFKFKSVFTLRCKDLF